MLDGWSGRQLALELDATTLGQRFVVLVVSVVYRGCAVPVAWKIVRATEKYPWQPEWLALLKHFQGVVPAGWTVIVLADRGLETYVQPTRAAVMLALINIQNVSTAVNLQYHLGGYSVSYVDTKVRVNGNIFVGDEDGFLYGLSYICVVV